MNKTFKNYAIAWAILFVAYNVIVFVVRPIIPGYIFTYDARFWLAWVFVVAAFVGQLACAFIAFKSENKEKMFLNIPLITESYSALILMAVVSTVVMLIPDCPAFVSACAGVIICAFSAVTVLKAKVAADIVVETEEKVKAKTQFIKLLTVDAEGLLNKAGTPEVKTAVKKVYEAIRYSDPMSNDALSDLENQIAGKFNEFADAVAGDAGTIAGLADELVELIGERNKKCRILK